MIASIHQPSTSTFSLFDKLLLLSSGKVCYNGPLTSIPTYLEALGAPVPPYVNIAEHLLDLSSSDFAHSDQAARERILDLHAFWQNSPAAEGLALATQSPSREKDSNVVPLDTNSKSSFVLVVGALLHRSFIKSYRDVVAYGIRFAMYIGIFTTTGQISNTYLSRPLHHDGNRMASSTADPNIDSTLYKRHCTSHHPLFKLHPLATPFLFLSRSLFFSSA